MEQKYSLSSQDIVEVYDHETGSYRKLHRIIATRSFGTVRAGDRGGYIEAEKNLSHDGNSWVYGLARVYGNASVCDDAVVYGYAKISGNAKICRNAYIGEYEEISGDTVLDHPGYPGRPTRDPRDIISKSSKDLPPAP